MTDRVLEAFLAAPSEDASGGGVDALELALQSVLGSVIERAGRDRVGETTGIDAARLAALAAIATDERSEPTEVPLGEAAEILAVECPNSAAEIRGRLRDHLLLAMSRVPTDLEGLCDRYGLGDPATLRAAIEGETELSLRTYARLRVALGPNHNP